MNASSLVFPINQSRKNLGVPYLRLQLDRQTLAALPMKNAQEVVVVSSRRITPIPKMPDCVIGLINQRSRVFWVVDLAKMLNLEAINKDVQEYNIAIIRVGNMPLGLAIREVKGVMRLNPDSIQSPIANVSSSLMPYLQGCVLIYQSILLVLDAEAIVNSTMLHSK